MVGTYSGTKSSAGAAEPCVGWHRIFPHVPFGRNGVTRADVLCVRMLEQQVGLCVACIVRLQIIFGIWFVGPPLYIG